MRRLATFFIIVFLAASTGPAHGQPRARHVDLKVEPLAYAFGGAGGHVGVHVNDWTYEVEVFGLEIPESLHGNDGFRASPLGIELHVERFFGENLDGFYAGPEAGLVRLDVTHRASGRSERHLRYSVGLRGGYRWYTGLGHLYISPVLGVSYTLNGGAIEVGNDTFETAPLGPWGTVGLGWSFFR